MTDTPPSDSRLLAELDVTDWMDEAHRALAELRRRLQREPTHTEFAMAIFVNPKLCISPAARLAPLAAELERLEDDVARELELVRLSPPHRAAIRRWRDRLAAIRRAVEGR